MTPTDQELKEEILWKGAIGGWIQTYSGRRINILPDQFNPDEIVLADILISLPHINRYVGQTPYPYSVAQHCIVLAKSFRRQREELEKKTRKTLYATEQTNARVDELKMLERYALIHDWPEYAIGDYPAPFKQQFPAVKDLDHMILSALAKRNGLPEDEPLELVEMDRRLCRNEMDVLNPPVRADQRWWDLLDPVPFVRREDLWERPPSSVRAELFLYAKELNLS